VQGVQSPLAQFERGGFKSVKTKTIEQCACGAEPEEGAGGRGPVFG